MKEEEQLLCQIEQARRKLNLMLGDPSYSAAQRLAASRELDRLIVRYQKLLAGGKKGEER